MGTMTLVFERQGRHLAALLVLLAGAYDATGLDGFGDGSFLGLGTAAWFWLTVGSAVVHQVYVWLCWRLELHGGVLTRQLGRAAFPAYAAGFTILIVARPILITGLAWSNRGTLPVSPVLTGVLAGILAIPGVYTMYSVKRYFGTVRAFGIDHFDPSYRTAGLVREGMFKYSSNAMYHYGFLLLWVPGFAFQSVAALVAAAFSHLYILVHYACTEKPDMDRIYGG